MKRIGFLTTILTMGIAASIFAVTTTIESYSLDQGAAISGSPSDMTAADGQSAVFSPNGTGAVALTFDTSVTMNPSADEPAPTHGTFAVYSRTMGRAMQTVELYNYTDQHWVRVYSRPVGAMDARGVRIDFKEAANFICPMGHSRAKARVTWTGNGSKGNLKSVSVDYVEWNFRVEP